MIDENKMDGNEIKSKTDHDELLEALQEGNGEFGAKMLDRLLEIFDKQDISKKQNDKDNRMKGKKVGLKPRKASGGLKRKEIEKRGRRNCNYVNTGF